MTTSGFYHSWVDTLVSCRCGYLGWLEACENTEDKTTTWDCPGCGHHPVEEWGDGQDNS
jgi:hypothetical protein